MSIINDYEAIARRLRELSPPADKGGDLKKWRDHAEETARTYVESRRQGSLADILRRPAHSSAAQHGNRPIHSKLAPNGTDQTSAAGQGSDTFSTPS